MSRLTFKRVALALVASLSFGVLATGPTFASQDEALTATPSATTVELSDSLTATIDLSFISDSASESLNVRVVKTGAGAFTNTVLIPLAADSANVGGLGTTDAASATAFGYTEINASTTADQFTATAQGVATRAKWTLRLGQASTAGSATYTVSLRSGGASGGADTVEKAVSFTVTVTAADTTGVATRTLMYLNETSTAANNPIRNNGLGYLAADSTLVVNAGSPTNPRVVGTIFIEPRNASDTRTSTASRSTGATDVTASVNVQITGAGLLSVGSGTRGVSITAGFGETVSVWSNGTAGTGTITGFLGGVALSQAAKTVTFVGIADTFIPTVESSTVVRGSRADGAITFVARDAAGNAITGTNTQYRTGTPGGFFIFAADTKVVGGTTWTPVDRGAGSTAAYGTCSYSDTRARWVCNVPITDSGVATTIYIGDSYTATSSIKESQALTLTVAGTGNTGTISFGGTSFNTGAKATITVTSKDGDGRNVANGPSTPFSGLRWASNAPTFGAPTGSDASGGDASGGLTTYLANGGSYVNGVDTLVVYMPTVTGTYTLIGVTGTSAAEQTLATFTVVNPDAAVTNAAIAAAQASADAATDAANEAIDAANAATDAANIAAEAADAATVAAEEARDAADAATAAVEELATQVATLMAALSAQVKTLANTVAKIAKKVKA